MKIGFYTLGCKVNQYDTQTMAGCFEAAGWSVCDFDEDCDAYLINTCTVTATSDKKSRQLIAQTHRRAPSALIIVAGCYAKRDASAVLAIEGVGVALGTAQRKNAPELAKRALEQKIKLNATGESANEYEELFAIPDGKTRAHLKIQDGCNNFCSYCIIPYVRGRIRSRSLKNAVSETRRLVSEGFCEIVLTGIHLASYNDDGRDLTTAINEIAAIDGVERLRLGSLEPVVLTDAFLTACADNPNVCRHFHVSLQSGSSAVLKRMNRRYTAEQYAKSIEKLRGYLPEAAVTTDIIAGFCGETEAEHRETLEFAKKTAFARIHVFPFSAREGTAAAKMTGQLAKQIKEERARELIALGERLENAYIDRFIGTVQGVLFEDGGEGYTDTYIRVASSQPQERGKIQRMLLAKRDGQTAIGTRAAQNDERSE